MNKLKTAKVHLVKFLFILPLLALYSFLFRKQIGDPVKKDDSKQLVTDISGNFTDTIPDVMELNSRGYYTDIKGKDGNCVVVVRDKSRKEVERVLLTKWNENQKYYENLYGEIIPPPPPPPVPPTTKKIPTPPLPPDPPVKKTVVEADAAREVSGANVANVSDDFEITETSATMRLKNGTTEKYNLKDAKERSAFEKKYGKIINVSDATSLGSATKAVVTSGSGESVITSANPVTTAITSNGVLAMDDNGYIINGKEDIRITITKKTTSQQLEEYIKQMKEKGIELKFDNKDFDNGILTHISGTMKFKDSHANFSATDFTKLILIAVRDEEHIYFKVRTGDTREVI